MYILFTGLILGSGVCMSGLKNYGVLGAEGSLEFSSGSLKFLQGALKCTGFYTQHLQHLSEDDEDAKMRLGPLEKILISTPACNERCNFYWVYSMRVSQLCAINSV